VHRVLAGRDDRFDVISTPPHGERTGECRWDVDSACRKVGWRPRTAVTPQEKIERIHDLAKDEVVAVSVARTC
jgi:hypothetical protein